MTSCTEIRSKVQLLIDRELKPDEESELFQHIESCGYCHQALEQAQAFSSRIRAARRHVHASEALRQRVMAALAAGGNREVQVLAEPRLVPRRNLRWGRSIVSIAAIFIVAVAVTLFFRFQRSRQTTAMLQIAMAAHRDLQQNRLPLDIETESSGKISEWFMQRVSFPFHLANAGIAADDRAKYELIGGKVMNVNGKRVALVSFRLSNEQISMLVGPGALPIDTGGTLIRSDGLILHARDRDAMHVVSWRNRGLSYVAVSRATMTGSGSCILCHRSRTSDTQSNASSNQIPSLPASLDTIFLTIP
ncbi:zf-HC2 domain-containing protein [Granulicella sp. L60]|uniref:anti-sigma factor n=1 Tax=Granulicella sp. L60 TaxID=1641866 RepID=UPI00131CCE3C|nr:zf-HC2 domain-containing protein [Granulicella sp. L60]